MIQVSSSAYDVHVSSSAYDVHVSSSSYDTEALCDTAVLCAEGTTAEEREAARAYYERCLAVDPGLFFS